MEWIYNVSMAIDYIESNLTNKIVIADISQKVHLSGSYFQRMFKLIAGVTVGDYIRNRRLTLAGQEILYTNHKLIDIAFRYQYDT